jgi:hypothetical protein
LIFNLRRDGSLIPDIPEAMASAVFFFSFRSAPAWAQPATKKRTALIMSLVE